MVGGCGKPVIYCFADFAERLHLPILRLLTFKNFPKMRGGESGGGGELGLEGGAGVGHGGQLLS